MPPKAKVMKKQDARNLSSRSTKASVSEAVASTLNWPDVSPLVPAEDLTINTLLENQILTIPRLWTANLCRNYVNFLSSLPLVTTPGKLKRGEAVRVNDRLQINDAAFANQLWSRTALKTLVENPILDGKELTALERQKLWGGEVLGLNENIRIYRYSKGQFFDQHYDDFNNLMFPSDRSVNPVPAKTTWTLLLYMTAPATGCRGGETVFHPDPPSKREPAPPPVVAELEVGMALLHRHGKDCLLHEGKEVTDGEKWVIRSDLCVKR